MKEDSKSKHKHKRKHSESSSDSNSETERNNFKKRKSSNHAEDPRKPRYQKKITDETITSKSRRNSVELFTTSHPKDQSTNHYHDNKNTKQSEKATERNKKKLKKRHSKRRSISSSSGSSDDSHAKRKKKTKKHKKHSSDSEQDDRKTKKSKKHSKKKKKKAKELITKVPNKEHLTKLQPLVSQIKCTDAIGTHESITSESEEVKIPKKRAMVPMTKEEYDRQQNVVRRVFDPETGRNRLVKESGEILEEIVSQTRHKEINKMSTMHDGQYFASSIGLNKR